MDTKKDCKIPECGDLAKLSHSKLVVGAKQLRKALQSGRARKVYLAKDADPAINYKDENADIIRQKAIDAVIEKARENETVPEEE